MRSKGSAREACGAARGACSDGPQPCAATLEVAALEFLHSGLATVGQTIGLCRLSPNPRLTLAMVLSLSHRCWWAFRCAVGDRVDAIGHDHARVELVEPANRLPVQESVHNYTGECLARHDRPRKTMVCPTFSQKCTNSSAATPGRYRQLVAATTPSARPPSGPHAPPGGPADSWPA